MNDTARIAVGAVVGGLLGAAAAHLFFTAQGRRTLYELHRALSDASAAAQDLRSTLGDIAEAAREGRRVVRELQSTSA